MITTTTHTVHLEMDGHSIRGELAVPENPRGVVIFATETAGAHHSRLETDLAALLHDMRLGTLVVGLLSTAESADRTIRTDVELLTERLRAQVEWLSQTASFGTLDIAVCSVGTGVAAAVEFVLSGKHEVASIAVLNGRVDLVESLFQHVDVPILFWVDEEHDHLHLAHQRLRESNQHTTTSNKHLHAVDSESLFIIARWIALLFDSAQRAPKNIEKQEKGV